MYTSIHGAVYGGDRRFIFNTATAEQTTALLELMLNWTSEIKPK